MNLFYAGSTIIIVLALTLAGFVSVRSWRADEKVLAQPGSERQATDAPATTASSKNVPKLRRLQAGEVVVTPAGGDGMPLPQAFKIIAERESAPEAEVIAALTVIEQAVEDGNAKAMQVYADLLLVGDIVRKDALRAARLYEDAIRLGNERARVGLGFMLAHGRGISQDTSRAIEILEPTLKLEQSTGVLKLLGDLYKKNGDPVAAEDFYHRALRKGDASSAVALGDLWLHGGERSFPKAERYYREALALGSARALRLLADLYYAKDNALRDVGRAAEYYRDAVLVGDYDAAIQLARMWTRGEAANTSREELTEYLGKLSEGDRRREASKALGDILAFPGSGQDLLLAIEHYHQAAMLGDGWASLALGDLAQQQEGAAFGLGTAEDFYDKAAEAGVARAYVRLGDLTGRSGRSSLAGDPLLYYRLAEAAGDPLGTLRLARAEQDRFEDPSYLASAAARFRSAYQSVGSAETVRHLRSGDKRSLVAMVQYLLGSNGYDVGSIDGVAGSKTLTALTRFCDDRGLSPCDDSIEKAPLAALLTAGSATQRADGVTVH